jgi:TPR repeat protein
MLLPACAGRLGSGATPEKRVVAIDACDLRVTVSERWTEAPASVFVPTGNFHGLMLGRQGLVDAKGQPVIPTVGVLCEPITYVVRDEAHDDLDPLDAYMRERRMDGLAKDVAIVRRFSSRDGLLKLERAAGIELAATLNGRPSKALVVYTISERRKVGIQIVVEVPTELWPQLRPEVEAILASVERHPSPLPVEASRSNVPPLDPACGGAAAASCAALAVRLAEGDGVAKDGPRSIELFRRACEGGDAGACFNLGLSYDRGSFVPADKGQALSLYRRACDGRNPPACVNLAWSYENGAGVAKSGATAAELYGKACAFGNATGCSNLGHLYMEGDGVAKDPSHAAELYAKSCEGGEALGCDRLGACYRDGTGVSADRDKAVAAFTRACDSGSNRGCSDAASQYMTGGGGAADVGKGVALAQKGCDGGDARGCTALGLAYVAGEGVVADRTKAKALFAEACKGEDALGCACLGHVYDDAHDSARAAEFFRKACALGMQDACASIPPK